jgi:hypothetical protein
MTWHIIEYFGDSVRQTTHIFGDGFIRSDYHFFAWQVLWELSLSV